jgi:hypothetical protein
VFERKLNAVNILNFINHFPDEQSCKEYLKAHREKQGIYFKTCKGFTKQYWFSARKCRRRTSLKAGTVMENSYLSLHTWFAAFLLMSATKKGLSCMEIQRQLGLKKYQTAFRLMHKIREVMGKRDSSYMLKGMVEYDEAYVEKAAKGRLSWRLPQSPLL